MGRTTKMKNALILHGSGNNSQGNWFPWLKQELESRDWKVWTPDFPNADHPDMDEWCNYVFDNNEWQFNKESVIIGHSAGATLILGILQRFPPDTKINTAILVAGCVQFTSLPEVNEVVIGLLKYSFDWKKIKSSCENFYFIHSDNDRYECNIEQGKIMQKHLGGKLIYKPGEDHFNLETNPKYKKFPLIPEILKEK
jgi:predicted alpha/beta hydrolase family esterase